MQCKQGNFLVLLRRLLPAFTCELALRAQTALQSQRYARKTAKISLTFTLHFRHIIIKKSC